MNPERREADVLERHGAVADAELTRPIHACPCELDDYGYVHPVSQHEPVPTLRIAAALRDLSGHARAGRHQSHHADQGRLLHWNLRSASCASLVPTSACPAPFQRE